MLPYTPLHHLLAADAGAALVLTSGNRSDEPIAFEDGEAEARLAGIADAVLGHDRPIHRRCEDSVVAGRVPAPPLARLRPVGAPGCRSRPPGRSSPPGAELKGDVLRRPRPGGVPVRLTWATSTPSSPTGPFSPTSRSISTCSTSGPEVIAHDLHPEYLATKWAVEQDAELVGVQHHHAHAAACLAEHGETGPALGARLRRDGLRHGRERCGAGSSYAATSAPFERLAHLEPVPLPGGEAAIREPWRTAAVHLELAGRPVPFERWQLVRESLKVNAPLSSGMGRLFDAVAALLGVREEVSYEGQAAIELELLAGDTEAAPYDWASAAGRSSSRSPTTTSPRAGPASRSPPPSTRPSPPPPPPRVPRPPNRPQQSVARPETVVLWAARSRTSGCSRRPGAGWRGSASASSTHRQVPPNDGGISYGQAAVAAWKTRAGAGP